MFYNGCSQHKYGDTLWTSEADRLTMFQKVVCNYPVTNGPTYGEGYDEPSLHSMPLGLGPVGCLRSDLDPVAKKHKRPRIRNNAATIDFVAIATNPWAHLSTTNSQARTPPSNDNVPKWQQIHCQSPELTAHFSSWSWSLELSPACVDLVPFLPFWQSDFGDVSRIYPRTWQKRLKRIRTA